MTDWNKRFLDLAAHVSTWSKDPSTQVGAVIVDRNKIVMGIGYNGFPRGVEDAPERLEDRSEKYPRMVHAEINAILNSLENPRGMSIYCTHFPCSECAKCIIQVGISHVYAPKPSPEIMERWGRSFELTKEMFKEAGVFWYLT